MFPPSRADRSRTRDLQRKFNRTARWEPSTILSQPNGSVVATCAEPCAVVQDRVRAQGPWVGHVWTEFRASQKQKHSPSSAEHQGSRTPDYWRYLAAAVDLATTLLVGNHADNFECSAVLARVLPGLHEHPTVTLLPSTLHESRGDSVHLPGLNLPVEKCLASSVQSMFLLFACRKVQGLPFHARLNANFWRQHAARAQFRNDKSQRFQKCSCSSQCAKSCAHLPVPEQHGVAPVCQAMCSSSNEAAEQLVCAFLFVIR